MAEKKDSIRTLIDTGRRIGKLTSSEISDAMEENGNVLDVEAMEKLYEELLRDEETDTATSKEKIFIAKPEQVAWADVENMLRTLHECLDNHGDIKACMHKLLPSFKTPEEVNGRV